eukprot:806763_1
MDEVFHGIDQIQDTHSLYPMESEPFEEEIQHDICSVYFHTSWDHHRYEFSFYPFPTDKTPGYQEIATLKNHLPDTFATKWAVFISQLKDAERYDFGMDIDASSQVTNGKDMDIIPSGYWHIRSEGDHNQTLNYREWLDDNTALDCYTKQDKRIPTQNKIFWIKIFVL